MVGRAPEIFPEIFPEIAVLQQVTWSEVGWSGTDAVAVRDLWARREIGVFRGGYASCVGPRDVRYLRLRRTAATAYARAT